MKRSENKAHERSVKEKDLKWRAKHTGVNVVVIVDFFSLQIESISFITVTQPQSKESWNSWSALFETIEYTYDFGTRVRIKFDL